MGEAMETEWVKLVKERYGPDPGVEMSYEDENEFCFLLEAAEQYEVEPQMLEYAKKHPKATAMQMIEYLDQIAPPGLPPCASEWDDDDDDDDE